MAAEQYKLFIKRTKGSVYGVMTLQRVIDGQVTKIFDKLPIASGQYPYVNGGAGDWVKGKGPTPIGKHWLSTKRDALIMEPKGTPFYVIGTKPGERVIYGSGGKSRSDCGVHLENRHPGSAGCPVLLHDTPKRSKTAWLFFEELDRLHAAGVDYIPLEVFF